MDTLLHAGLGNAVLAAALAAGAALVGLLCRRPALRHGLWLLVLLKLVTPPLVPLPVLGPAPAPRAEQSPPALAGPGDEGHGKAARRTDSPKGAGNHPRGNTAPRTVKERLTSAFGILCSVCDLLFRVENPPPPQPAPAPLPRAEPGRGGWSWQALVLAAWLAGSLAWWAVAAWRISRFRALFRHAAPAPPEVRGLARRLAGRLGLKHCPAVWLVPAPVSPLVWALGRSAHLLLPAALWDRLNPEQRQTLVAHELAHLRRRDHWVRRLELVALGLYWWHPVAWWARKELREAEEQCCDAWVVWALPEAAPAYAAALVETVAFLSQARPALPLAASGAGQVRTLKRRLTMILRGTPPRALSGLGVLALLALGALLLPLLPTRAQQTTREEPKKQQRTTTPTVVGQTTATEAPARSAATTRAVGQTAITITREDTRPAIVTGTVVGQTTATREVSGPASVAVIGQATSDTTANRAAVAGNGAAAPAGQAEALRDEIELLEVQLEAKQAEVHEAEARLAKAAADLKRVRQLNQTNAVSQGEINQAESTVQIRRAQLDGKRALLREVQVRLKQAQRRLNRLGRSRATESAAPEKAPVKLWNNNPLRESIASSPEAASKDFGPVRRGTRLSYVIPLDNGTRQPVHIAAVRTSSGAVTATPDTHDIAPGKQAHIRVVLDTGRWTGPKTTKVFVVFDRPKPAELVFTLRADARPEQPASGPGDREARLRELERKLDVLLKEVNALRGEIRPSGAIGGGKGVEK